MPKVEHLSLDILECFLHFSDGHSKLRTIKALTSLVLLFEVANLYILCLKILDILWLACSLDGRMLASHAWHTELDPQHGIMLGMMVQR